MKEKLLVAYFACNLVGAILQHRHMLREVYKPPRRGEVVVYFIVFTLIGLPALLISVVLWIVDALAFRNKDRDASISSRDRR